MSAWHREHPELAGTSADPWMANEGHRQAHASLIAEGRIDCPECDNRRVTDEGDPCSTCRSEAV